jgi:S-adenosylmethionine:tRNA ribosyltransferase-isomerase
MTFWTSPSVERAVVQLTSELPLAEAIDRYGHVPLPPYIERDDAPDDAERYQTIFARESGSVAAPDRGIALHPGADVEIEARGTGSRRGSAPRGCRHLQAVEVEDPDCT